MIDVQAFLSYIPETFKANYNNVGAFIIRHGF